MKAHNLQLTAPTQAFSGSALRNRLSIGLSTMSVKGSHEVVFNGTSVTAVTSGIPPALRIIGHSVSDADVGGSLAIRGGTNFIIGTYLVAAMDPDSNAWTLDRPCSTETAAGMTGRFIKPEGNWHKPVPEYYDPQLPHNPGKGQARQAVLKTLNLIEPEVLKALAERCLKSELLEPEAIDIYDWCCPVEYLMWGQLPAPVAKDSPDKTVYLGNLRPLRNAIVRWAEDEPTRRWNLCDGPGEPLEWVADTAVQTLVWWYVDKRGKLPKNLRWQGIELDCYRSLDSEEALTMFDVEGNFDAGGGFLRVAPEDGVEASRLSARAQRTAKKEYKTLGNKLGLTRMQRLSPRFFEWYVLQTFFGLKLSEIREREMVTTRNGDTGLGIGDLSDPNDLSAIIHGIKQVADLVGFRRKL